jgi:group I intron endonuclease
MNFVYLTTNLINGKQYVGSHEGNENDNYLGSGKPALSNAIKKYGKENFSRDILEICDPSLNLLLEEKYIKKFNTLVPNGYNISPTGGLNGGGHHSEESKRKISKSSIGKPPTRKGVKLSKETKEKLRISHLGKNHSEESKKKISESKLGQISPRKGVILSKETRKKISEAKKGKSWGHHSEESKKKMSEAKKGIPKTSEHKKKISEAKKGSSTKWKGQHHSEESKKKMSEAKKGKNKGSNNPMYARSPYDIWVEKYGKEEADKRKKALYEKRSKNKKM